MTVEPKPALNIQQELFGRKRSALRTYQDLAVGAHGWGALLRYECMQMFLRGLPGAWGILMRRMAYRRWLGAVGRNVTFGVDVTIRHPHKIRIGDNVVIDDHCVLDAKGSDNRGIVIGSRVVLGRNSILQCKNGDIELGNEVNIGVNCVVTSSNRVVIGDKVLIAAFSYLVGGGHDFSRADMAVMDQARMGLGLRVGAGSWIGAGAVVLDGLEIGAGSIVGATSVVNRSLPDDSVAVGSPARVVRNRRDAEEGGASS